MKKTIVSRQSRSLDRSGRRMSVATGALAQLARVVTSRRTTPVLVLLLMVTFFVIGAVGVDFGTHWDEWYHTDGVADCITRLSLYPKGVSYGGPYFTLGFPVVLAHEWRHLAGLVGDLGTQGLRTDPASYPSLVQFKASALSLVSSRPYLLQVRQVFLGLSSLAPLWMFLAARRAWPRRTGPALGAAAFMALSWELGYHARWVAVDALLAQVAALELFLFVGTWRAASSGQVSRWYTGTAVAAGAVFGCKLTGVFGVLPVILSALLLPAPWRPGRRLALLLWGAVCFVVTAFVLSPEVFLEPVKLLFAVRGGNADYGNVSPADPYYVTRAEHVGRLLVWLGGAVPSPFPVVALGFSAIALAGLASLLRRPQDRRMTLVWLSFPVGFVSVFGRNHLLLVRQYLMCIPVLAFWFARGLMATSDFLRPRWRPLGWAFAALVVGGMLANATFEAERAWTITRDSGARVNAAAAADLLRSLKPVRMSQTILDRLRPYLGAAYVCRPGNPTDRRVEHVLAAWGEYAWKANRLGNFRHAYGAAEVNPDYYATWAGKSLGYRILDLSWTTVKSLVPAAGKATDLDCFPTGAGRIPFPGAGGRGG